MKRICRFLLIFGMSLVVSACAQQPLPYADNDAPGFLLGLVHGFISFFSLIGHAVGMDVRVYAFPNSGGWYDAGFVLGCSLFYGGGASQY
ncbi:hypothetical protein [Bradyrhizobium sp. HKCCYLR20261]|uniref:hypothetical protein n=1 Tax=Bradyrhizobium sp. HKCCYLR20261 TaxID=3420760 RepID=UPI003EBABCA3